MLVAGGHPDHDKIYEYEDAAVGNGRWVLLSSRVRTMKHEPTAFKVRKDIFPKC